MFEPWYPVVAGLPQGACLQLDAQRHGSAIVARAEPLVVGLDSRLNHWGWVASSFPWWKRTACGFFAGPTSRNGAQAPVDVDGDTVDLLVTVGGQHQQVRVRLTEIDTPERGQPWGNRAKQALAEKVFRQDVVVEMHQSTDAYGRILGRIWLGDRDINRELVREGYAWAYREYLTDPSFLEDEQTAVRSVVPQCRLPPKLA